MSACECGMKFENVRQLKDHKKYKCERKTRIEGEIVDIGSR